MTMDASLARTYPGFNELPLDSASENPSPVTMGFRSPFLLFFPPLPLAVGGATFAIGLP